MRNLTIILTICWLFAGCEQETIVDPSINYMSHKLSVSATLDTDGGQFQAHVYKTRPVSEHGWRYEDTPDIRTGHVILYEDGEPVLNIEQEFDLCGVDMQKKLSLQGISAKAGSVYRLEIAIDGYNPVTATATMPDAPQVKSIIADTSVLVNKRRIYQQGTWGLLTSSGFDIKLYLLQLVLEHRSLSKEYYSIQALVEYSCEDPADNHTEIVPIGSDDWTILSSNPEMEAIESVWAEETYELYAFIPFLFDNLSTREVTFYMGYYKSEYKPQNKLTCHVKHHVTLKHLSEETFRYYRSVCLQGHGLDFFSSEPSAMPSNIRNGYGCFSVCNSVRFVALEYINYYSK